MPYISLPLWVYSSFRAHFRRLYKLQCSPACSQEFCSTSWHGQCWKPKQNWPTTPTWSEKTEVGSQDKPCHQARKTRLDSMHNKNNQHWPSRGHCHRYLLSWLRGCLTASCCVGPQSQKEQAPRPQSPKQLK